MMATLDEVLAAASDTISVDLSGVTEFSKIEPGTYVGVITSVEASTSKVGNPTLVWKANVADGEEHAGSFIPITSTNLDGAAAWRSVEWIEALGLDPDKFSTKAAVGRKATFTCVQNGEYVNVDKVTKA